MPSTPKYSSTTENSPIYLPLEDKGSQKCSDQPSYPQKVESDSLFLKTKKIERLPADYEVESCALCGIKQRPDWIVTLFDDSWGFLCGPCGYKLSQKLNG